MVGLTHVLFTGAALFAAGAFIVGFRRNLGAALGGVPLMLAGAGLDLVGVSRFAGSVKDPVAGQEMAVIAAGIALAFAALGAGLARREAQP